MLKKTSNVIIMAEAEVFEMLTKLDKDSLLMVVQRLDMEIERPDRYEKSQLLKMTYQYLCSEEV